MAKKSVAKINCVEKRKIEDDMDITYPFDYVTYSIVDFVDTFPEIAHVKDIDTHKYVLTNKNNLVLFGFKSKKELIGKDVFDLSSLMKDKWPDNYANNIQKYDDQVIDTQKPIFARPDEFLDKEGYVVIHSFMKIPLFDFSKKLRAILTLVFDSTKQESLEILRNIYTELYNCPKIGDEKFLQFIGVDSNNAKRITKRELDFILSVIKHRTLKEVANDLDISIKGVEALCARLRKILKFYTTAELINFFTSKLNYKV